MGIGPKRWHDGSDTNHSCRGTGGPSPCSHPSHGGRAGYADPTSSWGYALGPSPTPTPPNPDPANYEWEREQAFKGPGGEFLVVEIKYPDCTNFEGRKILVYKGFNNFRYIEKKNKRKIDPHFCNHTAHASPIARFEPNAAGWFNAVSFAEMMATTRPG